MKENEIRIGNYLPLQGITINIGLSNDTPVDGIIQVTKENIANILHDIEIRKPILLTEELIIKLGFIRNGLISREFDLKEIRLIQFWEDGFLFIANYWKAGIYVKYVHQLQNLYFDLTNEELKIE